MRTKKDIPTEVSKHIDLYDMVGMYHPPGTTDYNGAILQKPWIDGGDSCHFTGIYHYLYALIPSFRHRSEYYGNMIGRLYAYEAQLRSITIAGGYKRHPDSAYWYSDDNRMSRDQATPMLASLAITESTSLRAQVVKQLLRLGIFATNTRRNGATKQNHGTVYGDQNEKRINYNWKLPDLMLFDIWSIYIRGLRLKWLYPILLLGDLQTYATALQLRADSDMQETDIANFFIKHSLSQKLQPTFISNWTQKLLPTLKLEERVQKRYNAKGMPLFIGTLLQEAIRHFSTKQKA